MNRDELMSWCIAFVSMLVFFALMIGVSRFYCDTREIHSGLESMSDMKGAQPW